MAAGANKKPEGSVEGGENKPLLQLHKSRTFAGHACDKEVAGFCAKGSAVQRQQLPECALSVNAEQESSAGGDGVEPKLPVFSGEINPTGVAGAVRLTGFFTIDPEEKSECCPGCCCQ